MMRNAADDHPEDELLEEYSLGRLPDPQLAGVEEHLLVCDRCRLRLAETDAFVSAVRGAAGELREAPMETTHHTERGPIRLRVEKTAAGDWQASIAGQEIEATRKFATVAEANEYVLEAFRQGFPGHECDERCECGFRASEEIDARNTAPPGRRARTGGAE